MKQLFCILAVLCYFTFEAIGATEVKTDSFSFEYKNGSTDATITRYRGSDTIIYVPKTIQYGNVIFNVVAIEQLLLLNSSNQGVTQIFIPSSVKTLTGAITSGYKPVKTIVFENGGIEVSTNTKSYPFSYDLQSGYNLNNIITLTPCTASKEKLFGPTFANQVAKIEKIQITHQGGETIEAQMFLINTITTFGRERLDYLINALSKNGIAPETVTSIDIGGSYIPTFNFAEYDDLTTGLAPGATVSVTIGATSLPDESNFTAPKIDTNMTVAYTRDNTKNWNSFCLPFDVKEADFDAEVQIYQITSGTNERIQLTRAATAQTILPAGTPFFLHTDAETLTINADKTIKKGIVPKEESIDCWKVIGSFAKTEIGGGKYKITADGSAFGQTKQDSACTYPFRCYLEYTGSTAAPERLSTQLSDETKITIVNRDNQTQQIRLYDLMGRPAKAGKAGWYIKAENYH